MNEKSYILVINPGSTSTKIALFKNDECIAVENLTHDVNEIGAYETIYDQKNMRTEAVLRWIGNQEIHFREIAAVAGRGGLLRPMPGGVYRVTGTMLEDLKTGYQGQHASNLGGIIADNIVQELNIPAFIVDPVSVDEMGLEARISGMPEIPRKSLVHALNIKSVTRRVCARLNKEIEQSSYVVAHMGGGISVAPVKNGRIIDVNNANEEGPFSPERSGGLPVGEIVKIAFSGKYTYNELKKKIVGQGGLMAYLGTNDGRTVSRMIDEGNKKAELIFNAMAYGIAKEIGAMAAVLKGKLDAIILTGGLAYNKKLTDKIVERVSFIAPIEFVPGEDEMLALAEGALRVIRGQERAKIYEKEVII